MIFGPLNLNGPSKWPAGKGKRLRFSLQRHSLVQAKKCLSHDSRRGRLNRALGRNTGVSARIYDSSSPLSATPMRVALVAPPFITVPPQKYGGTELFVAELALSLQREGIDVTVYTNGQSTIDCPTRWFYDKGEWPLSGEVEASLKGLNHAAWAIKEAAAESDVIHLNNAPALTASRFVDIPLVFTIHHAHDAPLAEFYRLFPHVSYVTISRFQQSGLRMPCMRAIHHGIDVSRYRLQEGTRQYLSFLGR